MPPVVPGMSIRSELSKFANDIARADADLAEEAAPFRKTAPVRALSAVSELGDQPQLRMISSALLAVGLFSSNRRLTNAGARMLITHELSTLAKSFIKHRIDRTRPRSARSHDQRKLRPGKSRAKEKSSFPSGHSAGAVAVARAYSREYPEHRTAALTAAGVIAAAQIPRCAHYMTDVGGGLVVGAAAEAVANLIWPVSTDDGLRKSISRARGDFQPDNRPTSSVD